MRRRRGMTLIELVAVVCAIGILAAILLDRFTLYQEIAERTQMDRTVAILRSALALKAAGIMTAGRFEEIASLRDDNPMDWLAERPGNYIGELFDPEISEIPPGSWYFDRKTRELAYRPRVAQHLVPAVPGRPEVRFRNVVRIEAQKSAARVARSEVSELTVVPSRPFTWSPAF